MPVILLTNRYSTAPLHIAEETVPDGFRLISLETNKKTEFVEKAPLADYFLASGRIRIDGPVLDVAAKLKMIQRTGVGLDSFDLDAIKSRKIPVYINAGINSASVAEHTLMLMLATLRRLPIIDLQVKKGVWEKQEQGIRNFELRGKTVGIVGVGNIGKTVARLLKNFDVSVQYYDAIKLPGEIEKELGITYASLERLISRVDILSLHCPLTSQTENIIGKKQLANMKKGSIIINTARGGLIDEDALAESLRSGHTRAAGLDVYAEEPLPENNPLVLLENAILTPHIGGITYDSFHAMLTEAMNNIKLFEEGKFEQIESRRLKL